VVSLRLIPKQSGVGQSEMQNSDNRLQKKTSQKALLTRFDMAHSAMLANGNYDIATRHPAAIIFHRHAHITGAGAPSHKSGDMRLTK
jgi:hypothetical protein